MQTELKRIKDRCHVDDLTGCWVWRGSTSASNGGKTRQPRVFGPDYTSHPSGTPKTVQTGNRASWHAFTGKAIPPGHRVYKSPCCSNGLCVNPAHLVCGTNAQWGESLVAKGAWRGVNARIQANRAIGRKRSKISAQVVREICASSETGAALALRLGVLPSIVSKARRGQMASMHAGNPFAGLIA